MPDRPYRIYILHGSQKRSLPQLRYYWGVIVKVISGETGYDPQDIHLFNKNRFGLRTTVQIGDDVIEKVHGLRVSKEVTTKFIDDVIRFWSEAIQVYFPAPGEMTEEQLIEATNATEYDTD